ncbi:SWI/SNF-related matrix-associated actin-dependent regulatorof chromatin subfamily B member 1 [Rhodotorula toruloides]|uniref:SWI/SNF-related matrix-associated actin-dependent regulatorof chromatin subfamily B member 1 n=1 Tax=Rhodotorula toruloides TaxID=5286 RepID=A0A511K7R8_RHOTO|nr:SWI/SNF-related matrix-associated actin-dependent regulatorof chromatin subfamily B member 1 [Rhodotorula toruloides]
MNNTMNGFATGGRQTMQGLQGYAGGQAIVGPGAPLQAAQRLDASPISSTPLAYPGATGGAPIAFPTQSTLQSSSATTPTQQALLLPSQQNVRSAPVAPPLASSSTAPQPAPIIAASEIPHDGGPPFKVAPHRTFTRVRETDPGEPFPSIAPDDQRRVKNWIERDVVYEEELVAAKQGFRRDMGGFMEDVVREQDWLGPVMDPHVSRGQFRLRFDEDKAKEEANGKRGQLRRPIPVSKAYLRCVATTPEILVPIRLELESDMYKLRDTFTWNLREPTITPEIFASHLCADLRLPTSPFFNDIVSAVKKQLADAQLSATYEGHLGASFEEVREENRVWFEERLSKRRRIEKANEEDEEEAPMLAADLEKNSSMRTDEMRVAIKLDITLDSIQLVDKFEWDISNPCNSPEAFAEAFAAELGLTGEFRTAIAHSIREQVDFYTKSLCILGWSKGLVIGDEDLRRDFLPSVSDPFRTDTADDYTPLLNQLQPEEVERHDREHEREIRRKRRQTKGRGLTLPDREPVRTHRTLVPRPLPGQVATQYDDRGNKIFPQPELSLPYPIVAKPYPPKPVNVETSSASPLKMLPSKDKAGGAGGLAATAAANRFKKGQAGDGAESPAKKKRLPGRVDPEALGLHEHFIDGKWYCANCGVPAGIAVGRRKGPTGKDSLCGTCGKYFHRYKRQRPCVYTRDLETHMRYKAEEDAKNPKPKRGKASHPAIAQDLLDPLGSARTSGRATPVSQAMSPVSSAHDDEDSDEEESSVSRPGRRRRPAHYGSPDTPFVHFDSDNSDDESLEAASPPATRLRRDLSAAASPPPSFRATPGAPPKPQTVSSAVPLAPPPQPPEWLVKAAADLRARQVDDRFDLIPRPRPADLSAQEWRIRCLDCPGKLYNLGPGETLDGFTVHFKNRNHRANVDARLAREQQQ